MPKMLDFHVWTANFGSTGTSRPLSAWGSVHRHIQHRYTSSLVPFNRYMFLIAPYGIWRRIIRLDSEKQGNSSQKLPLGNRKVSKKVNWKPPARFFHTPSFRTLVRQESSELNTPFILAYPGPYPLRQRYCHRRWYNKTSAYNVLANKVIDTHRYI